MKRLSEDTLALRIMRVWGASVALNLMLMAALGSLVADWLGFVFLGLTVVSMFGLVHGMDRQVRVRTENGSRSGPAK